MGTADVERLWSALVAVYHPVLRDVVRSLERDAGIDSGVYSALAYLERAEASGRMRLSELHEMMRVRYSQPGLSRLVQRMETDGLVERRPDPDDRRGTMLVLTRSGRARFRRAHRVYRAALDDHLGRFVTAEHARRVARGLEEVAAGRQSPTS